MTTYVVYFDKSIVNNLCLALRFVGITKTTPTPGEKLHFEELSPTIKLLCQNLSLLGDTKHNPGLVSEIITDVNLSSDGSLMAFTPDGTYLLDPVN
ncbi:MAG: hypothetical protein NTW35_01290 [Candidatus Nomurabacteria bacterium]|nr:hypothetical protein [Candidatus Nomurabacteria bacterium]